MPEPGEVVLAFDYGSRRIGVAVGQTTTGSAGPAGVVPVGSSTSMVRFCAELNCPAAISTVAANGGPSF